MGNTIASKPPEQQQQQRNQKTARKHPSSEENEVVQRKSPRKSQAQNVFLEDRLHERAHDYDTADVLLIEHDVFTATLIKKYLSSTRIIKESDPSDQGRFLTVHHATCTSTATALIGKGKTYGLVLLHLSKDYTPTAHQTVKIMREMGYRGAIVFVATSKEFSDHKHIMRQSIGGSQVDGLIILGICAMKTELERYISILTKRNVNFI